MRDWPPTVVPRYRRAVFLDRDGTINRDTHFPSKIEELAFEDKALEGLCAFARLPVALIVVSNQAGIARGLFTVEQMSAFNAELRRRVERARARLDAFYYCPELEPKDLPPNAAPSPCAKPAPGMLLEAAADFELSLPESFMIGDKASDIAAGARAGCLTVLLLTGKAGKEEGAPPARPDYICENLLEASRLVEATLARRAVCAR